MHARRLPGSVRPALAAGMEDAAEPPSGFPDLCPAGEAALLVRFGSAWSPAIGGAVAAFDAALGADPPVGVIETVPTIASVLIRFDPETAAFEAVESACRAMLASADWYATGRPQGSKRWIWPVTYGGAEGPDLGLIADRAGLREDQVVDAHMGQPFPVLMLGFAPGLAYVGGLPWVFDLPRRKEVTAEVPAGAVLVAIRQTVLPATPIPTGWWRIGQARAVNFDPAAAQPFRIGPGDEIVFEAVRSGRSADARVSEA
jgi:inhibitor of KinA